MPSILPKASIVATDEVRRKLTAFTPIWVKWTGLQDRERELLENNRQNEVMPGRDSNAARDQILRQIEDIDNIEHRLMAEAKEKAAAC